MERPRSRSEKGETMNNFIVKEKQGNRWKKVYKNEDCLMAIHQAKKIKKEHHSQVKIDMIREAISGSRQIGSFMIGCK